MATVLLPRRAVGHERAALRDRKVGDMFQKHSYPLGIMSIPRVSLRGRGRRLPQLHLCEIRTGGDQAAAADRLPRSSTRRRCRSSAESTGIREITKAEAPTIESSRASSRSTRRANAHSQGNSTRPWRDKAFNPAILDGKGHARITPPKTNWAQRLRLPSLCRLRSHLRITFPSAGCG